ncbi:MAG: hemin uptake protein HemP [Pirellulaceae bacterium]
MIAPALQKRSDSCALNALPDTCCLSLSDPAKPADSQTNEPTDAGPVLPKIIKFNDLARCGDEVWIEFDQQIYRLRRTRQGKLILTK